MYLLNNVFMSTCISELHLTHELLNSVPGPYTICHLTSESSQDLAVKMPYTQMIYNYMWCSDNHELNYLL